MARIMLALMGLLLWMGVAQAQESGPGCNPTVEELTVTERAMQESPQYHWEAAKVVINYICDICPYSVFINSTLTNPTPPMPVWLEYEYGSEPPSVAIIMPDYDVIAENANGWNGASWNFSLAQACFMYDYRPHNLGSVGWNRAENILAADQDACVFWLARGQGYFVQEYIALEKAKKIPATEDFPVDYMTRVNALENCLRG